MALDDKERLDGEAALTKLRELLAHFRIASMVTVLEGRTYARPLGVVGDPAAFTGSLWFITDRRSRKVAQISAGADTSLLFQNDEHGTYAHMRGSAIVVEDRQKLSDLYTADQRTWFPDGVDDPNMTLVRFDVSDADYWDGHNNTARKALAYVTAVITGHPGRDGNTGVATLR